MGKYKGCKHTIRSQARHILQDQDRRGFSKHEAKREQGHRFGDRMNGIHSNTTFDGYSDIINRFIDYAEKELEAINCTKYIRISGLRDMAVEYMQLQEEKGLSPASLATYRAALCRIFPDLEYKAPSRADTEITRSRGEAVRDKRFSESRNSDLVEIARSTGGRRADIEKLTRDSFYERDGQLFVRFERSKGGRTRDSVVLNADRVREIIERRTENKDDRLFDRIHSAADVHAYRREYAKQLYQQVQDVPEFRERLQDFYKLPVSGKEYISRDGSKERYDKDAMAVVSKALGHNRIDTTIKNYIK